MIASMRHSAPTTSIAAWRRISSEPPARNDSLAPALANPSVSVFASTAMTWAFWVRWIQVTRRRALVASTMSGHRRRTSTRLRWLPAAVSAVSAGSGAAAGSSAGRLAVADGSTGDAVVSSTEGIGSSVGPSVGRSVGPSVGPSSKRGGANIGSWSPCGTGGGVGGCGTCATWAGVATGAGDGAGVAGTGVGAGVAGAAAAGLVGRSVGALTAPDTSRRRSIRSSLAITPSLVSSAPGSSTRAQISSSSSRGAVAPRISVSPDATMSAARLSSTDPKRAAWATSRSPASWATSRRPVADASGTAATITRSRSRRSRSSVNRRGSRPVSTTLSTTPKTAAPSTAANASTTSSRSVSGVNPSSAAARS